MRILPYIYLMYMFIALYMTCLFVLLYIKNRKTLFDYPKLNKEYSLSVIIPAYNEENSIEETVLQVLKSDYPGLKEVIVMNDGSVDKTREIVERLAKKYKKIKLVNKKNSGKADSINKGVEIARGELIAVIDADSYPEKDAMRKMIGFFDDENTGVVTSAILVKRTNKLLERLQAIEYTVIAWTRKLLEYVDSVYVTPGPLSIYRKDVIKKLRGFDTENLTEDIEMTWRLAYHGYGRKMCLSARVYTVTPSKLKKWFWQRVRWNQGGFQTIKKYRNVFLKKGMLGYFILPFFIVSLFLGVLGLGIFAYILIRRFVITRFLIGYSLAAETSLLTLEDLAITPSFLNIFGFTLFLFAALYTLFALVVMKEKLIKKENILNIPIYLLVYLTCYPLIIPTAIYKVLKKDVGWGTK